MGRDRPPWIERPRFYAGRRGFSALLVARRRSIRTRAENESLFGAGAHAHGRQAGRCGRNPPPQGDLICSQSSTKPVSLQFEVIHHCNYARHVACDFLRVIQRLRIPDVTVQVSDPILDPDRHMRVVIVLI